MSASVSSIGGIETTYRQLRKCPPSPLQLPILSPRSTVFRIAPTHLRSLPTPVQRLPISWHSGRLPAVLQPFAGSFWFCCRNTIPGQSLVAGAHSQPRTVVTLGGSLGLHQSRYPEWQLKPEEQNNGNAGLVSRRRVLLETSHHL